MGQLGEGMHRIMYKGSQDKNRMVEDGMKGIRRNNEMGICPICSKEEEWNLIMRCDETKAWNDEFLDDLDILMQK
jgi:hypothetical protein